ncbi:MAG: GNAT family N-acetyltransferase [Gemmatimonadota bacterium]
MIANCDIGLARRADAEWIASLSRDAIEDGLDWTWTPGRVLRSVANPATNTIIARERDRRLGFAIMTYGDADAHLLLLAVDSARRRQGIGSALLAWLELTARTAGISRIRAEVRAGNGAARAFYRRQGFEQARVLHGYYQGVDDAMVLAKRVGAA